MASEDDKITVMSRLSNLKAAEEKFRKVSVTDNYTVEERELIRTYVQNAKTANDNESPESKFIWKVRGDPKNGLQRFQKRL